MGKEKHYIKIRSLCTIIEVKKNFIFFLVKCILSKKLPASFGTNKHMAFESQKHC